MNQAASPSKTSLTFPVGRHRARAHRILPIFLPFAGCPNRCVFCAQDKQSGASASLSTGKIVAALAQAEQVLTASAPGSLEVAFYGGTFTAIPDEARQACLDFFSRCKARSLLSYGRCSTRPDFLDPQVLGEIRQAGLSLIELGVQSFADQALARSRRGYAGSEAIQACKKLRESGWQWGIQLLPGMPGVNPDVFLADVVRAIELRPDALRFYPCLVPEHTALADLWRQGDYTPWELRPTIQTLGQALALAWQAEIPVIRLATAPEPEFDRAILAGPRHPSLGSLVQAKALQITLDNILREAGEKPRYLELPRACQGFMYGFRSELREWWKNIGLPPDKISYYTEEQARLWF